MDQELHRILLAGIEVRRLYDEAFDLNILSALEPKLFERLHRDLREHGIVDMRYRCRVPAGRDRRPIDLIRSLSRHPRKEQCLSVLRNRKIIIVTSDYL